ncbi:MAG TPA: flagellar motor protein MotB, partial [Chroococcales cyanobacterium]
EGEARKAGFEGKIEAKITERGLVISFSDAVFFQKGEAEIRPGNLPLFRKLMLPLSRMPNAIRIEGHTDDDPIHTERFPSNWELSTSRATSVVRYLIQSGLFGPKRLAAAGFGEYWPKAPNDTEANQAKNRRVDVVVLRSASVREKP